MIPKLYEGTAMTFTNNGLGLLTDAISCKVTEELNGSYELEMEYPVNGIHFEDIMQRSIILAKPNLEDQPQPFRVYRIIKTLTGIVSIYAHHISYDLSGIAIQQFANFELTVKQVVELYLPTWDYDIRTMNPCPFTFVSEFESGAVNILQPPMAIKPFMLGDKGITGLFGGEWHYDRWNCTLLQHRGTNRGVVIRYGKNLQDVHQEQEFEEIYSAIFPIWTSSNVYFTLTNKIVPIEGAPSINRVLVYDFKNEIAKQPTEAVLYAYALDYISRNGIGRPHVNLNVSVAQIEKSDEYKGLGFLETIALGDTVTVDYPKLSVRTEGRVTKLVYDVLKDRVDNVQLGDAKSTLADKISGQSKQLANLSGGGGVNAKTATITLLKDNWSGGEQTVACSDVTETNTVTVGWDAASKDAYVAAGIWCESQGNGTLTFTCSTTPTVNITVNVIIQ